MDKPQFDHYRHNAPEYTEQILWHRIVATIAVAVVIVALSAWGAYHLLKSSDDDNTTLAPLTASEDTPESGDSIQLASAAEPQNQPVTKSPVAAAEPTPEQPDTPVAVPTPMAAPAADKESVAALSGSIDTAKAAAPEFSVNTEILSKDITRAVLANVIVDLEPKETLENTAQLTDPFLKLYFYTDLDGRKDDRIMYTWMLNGKEVARIRVPVGSDRWRSHSSKNINKDMRGEWKVVVTDKQGDTLASSEFVIPDAVPTNP
ncbi:MAG: DUF2914 domain-containing protein [Ketobacter sp.]